MELLDRNLVFAVLSLLVALRVHPVTVLLDRMVQPDAMALVVHGTLAVRWPVVPVRNELACIGKRHVRIRFVAYRLAVLWNICVALMGLAVDLQVCE